MINFVSAVYLVLMFIALYFFFFYIILIIRNRDMLFYYPKPERNYSISVLVPAYNEESAIEKTVEHIFNSDYKNIVEVIVINDGSKDRTGEIAEKLKKKYKKLKVINKKNSGKADSLNQALKIAKGELIAITDADSFPEKESIRKLAGFFNDEKVAAVTSAVFIRNRENFLTSIQQIEYIILAWTRKLLDFIEAVYVTNGPLSIYRKSALREVRGFDTTTVTEDIDVTWNLLKHGYKTKMCLDAFVTTNAPTKFRAWWRQRERWGIGGIQAIIKYRNVFLKKGMLGFFVIPFVSLSILLSMGVFIFSLYLVLKAFISTYLTAHYSYIAETPFLRMQDINLNPTILIFFTAVLFITSFIYTRYILANLSGKRNEWHEVRNIFKRLFYLLIYLAFYPLVWFTSIYRMIKGDYRW